MPIRMASSVLRKYNAILLLWICVLFLHDGTNGFVTVKNVNEKTVSFRLSGQQDFTTETVLQSKEGTKDGGPSKRKPTPPIQNSFSVPLETARAKPQSIFDTLIELWNDPRPISDIVSSKDRALVGQFQTDAGVVQNVPYCIVSDEFEIENESFQILLYPRGRVVTPMPMGNDNGSTTQVSGPASAYLRYLPNEYGDEVDLTWTLRLYNTQTNTTLPIETSGGMPKSDDTWSAAMTFCTEVEAVESVGRATDWGSSSWRAEDVWEALGHLRAEGEICVFDRRKGETSFGIPPKGGVGAVLERAQMASLRKDSDSSISRDFRVGEVIVPTRRRGGRGGFDKENEENNNTWDSLNQLGIYPGVDYRIMTMADQKDTPIFSTASLSDLEKQEAKLALRPCGWKLQRQLYKKQLGSGKAIDWPVEVPHSLLQDVSTTRFNLDSALPRIISAFQRDWVAYTVALALAISPIPITLVARNFVSLYAIPSASMEPTLVKGDVLLVEKFPRVYQRTHRGDVILFTPPPTLRDIVTQSGSQLSSTSLFVKRVVGLPGDQDVRLDREEDNSVFINGELAVGPNRNMCTDEPLRLIDRLLENGKGKEVSKLGPNDLYVLGDCKAVSVDSRVFGTLPKQNVVGKPVGRIWPLNRLQFNNKF